MCVGKGPSVTRSYPPLHLIEVHRGGAYSWYSAVLSGSSAYQQKARVTMGRIGAVVQSSCRLLWSYALSRYVGSAYTV